VDNPKLVYVDKSQNPDSVIGWQLQRGTKAGWLKFNGESYHFLSARPGIEMYACNSSDSGGGGRKIMGSRVAWAKKVKPHLKTKW
jgi:hypothetical protein